MRKIKNLIIDCINLLSLISFSTGLNNLEIFNLGYVATGLNIFNVMAFIIASLYLVKLLFNNKTDFIRYSFSCFIFIIFTLLSLLVNKVQGVDVIYKNILLCFTVIYSIYLISYYNFSRLISLFWMSEFIVIVFNLILFIFYPRNCMMFYEGTNVLRGAFVHKNLLSVNMVFNIILCHTYWRQNRKKIRNFLILFSYIISFFFLVKTNSMTAIIILLTILAFRFLYKNRLFRLNPVTFLILLNVSVYSIVFYGKSINQWLVENFNRNLTLTGRTDIWIGIMNVLQNESGVNFNKWLGAGFSNVWVNESPIQIYMRSYTFQELVGAHNGFLEWILQIGIIGMIILLTIYLNAGRRLMYLRAINKLEFSFILSIFVMLLTFYITERVSDPLSYQMLLTFLIIIKVNEIYFKNIIRNKVINSESFSNYNNSSI